MVEKVDPSRPSSSSAPPLLLSLLGMALAGIALSCRIAAAEPVSVNRETGQGLVVSHAGNCYLLVPDHVLGRSLRLSISVGAPPVVGEATVFHSFAPAMDLAVAYVRGDLQGRCSEQYADLPASVDRLLDGAEKASLVRVRASGQVSRTDVTITEILYDSIGIKVNAGGEPLYQGTSGSFLFIDDVPVGMVVKAPDEMTGIALRIDAMVDRTHRLLAGGVTVGTPPAQPTEPAAKSAPAEGLALTEASCSAEPTRPDAGCGNLLTGQGPVVLPAPGRPIVIEIELAGEGDRAATVKGVDLLALEDAAAGPPKSVQVELDSSQDNRRRWRVLGSADMSPFGELSMSSGAGQFARRLRITITTAWKPDLPVRLDRVVVR